MDTDTGWRGGAQFGIVTQRPAGTTSRSAGYEFSSAPAATPLANRYVSQPKMANWTLVGRNATIDAHTVAHFDTGTDATIINSVFTSVAGSVAAHLIAAQRGALILRVHDVAATVDALKVWNAVAAVPAPRAKTTAPTIRWPDDD